MDDVFSRAVRTAFVQLFEKGLIYKGPRMVNWCPRCQTALADIEVEHEDRAGQLWQRRPERYADRHRMRSDDCLSTDDPRWRYGMDRRQSAGRSHSVDLQQLRGSCAME